MRLSNIKTDKYLLVSDVYPDGIILNRAEYIAACKAMTRADFECHQTLILSSESVALMSDTLDSVESYEHPRKACN